MKTSNIFERKKCQILCRCALYDWNKYTTKDTHKKYQQMLKILIEWI